MSKKQQFNDRDRGRCADHVASSAVQVCACMCSVLCGCARLRISQA